MGFVCWCGPLEAADALIGGFEWRDHRRAKKRAHAIKYARGRPNRVPHYRELIRLTQSTLAYADQAAAQLWRAANPMAAGLRQAEFRHDRPLIQRIIAQTERRVLHGEAVAANEKIVSRFAGDLSKRRAAIDNRPAKGSPKPSMDDDAAQAWTWGKGEASMALRDLIDRLTLFRDDDRAKGPARGDR